MESKDYFMYVLLCKGGSFYGGFTDDVQKRFAKHQAGKGAKYTKRYPPIKVLYYEEFGDKSAALRAEYAFKHQSRKEKERFLRSKGLTCKDWKY